MSTGDLPILKNEKSLPICNWNLTFRILTWDCFLEHGFLNLEKEKRAEVSFYVQSFDIAGMFLGAGREKCVFTIPDRIHPITLPRKFCGCSVMKFDI